MNCPTCDGDTIILEKRGLERRRACTGRCKQRFTTVEKLKEDELRQAQLLKDAKALAERITAEA